MDPIEISKQEYNELLAAKAERDGAVKRADTADEAVEALEAQVADLKPKVEAAEAAKTAAEERAEAAEAKATEADERSAADTLASERFEALGDGFKSKLGDKTKASLEAQARTMSNEDWSARIEEVAEAYGVEATAAGDNKDETVFNREEVAASKVTATGDKSPSREAQGSVVAGLYDKSTK